VVFAADFNAEAFDRPSLSLPGDENALIDAVAAANPRTVVVLNTGGPVLMPWLGRVSAVIEAWYPGEQDGASIAALLFGDVDPSGRLPVTFPQSQRASAISSEDQWPGVGLTATYSEGLEVGYRYNQATGVKPLFPFGFGLSYTHFGLSRLRARPSSLGVTLTVSVTNEGDRNGTVVPEAYLTQPPSADEPPDQLAAFSAITLTPRQTRTVRLTVPSSAFRAYLGDSWTTVPGSYTLSVGQSSSDLPLSVAVAAP
jgi:beta-glucosidase